MSDLRVRRKCQRCERRRKTQRVLIEIEGPIAPIKLCTRLCLGCVGALGWWILSPRDRRRLRRKRS